MWLALQLKNAASIPSSRSFLEGSGGHKFHAPTPFPLLLLFLLACLAHTLTRPQKQRLLVDDG